MYEQTFKLPYPIQALFMVGVLEQTDKGANIAIAWNEGEMLKRVRSMKPQDLQKFRDEIITEIVKSMDKRIPCNIIVY